MKALIVDDSATQRAVLRQMVGDVGLDVIEAANGTEAMQRFEHDGPDLVLLDVNMPDIDGFEVARRMRALRVDHWMPIIFLSAREQDADIERGIEAGGDDYLVKPVSPIVLGAKISAMRRLHAMRNRLVEVTQELAQANAELERLSMIDALTGISNRRHFDRVLATEHARAVRHGNPLTLALCDVDFFKRYNDRHGHPMGDRCLALVAESLKSVCRRPADFVARIGGEEFAILLPDTPESGARFVVESLRYTLSSRAVPHGDSDVSDFVTLSVGVCVTRQASQLHPETLVSKADEALYDAKRSGRNRYEILSL